MNKVAYFVGAVLAVLLSNCFNVAAQTYTYEGPFPYVWTCRPFSNDAFRQTSKEINAEYQYILDEDTDQRVFSGPFKGSQKLTLKDKNGNPFESSISISGNFKNDMQDGEWIYKYVYKNTIFTCTLNFENGLFNGLQTLEIDDNGVRTKNTIEFVDGHYGGEFILTGGSHNCDAHLYFSPEGLPIGNWIIKGDHLTHKVSFDENNKVIKARTIDNRTGEVREWPEPESVLPGAVDAALHTVAGYRLPKNEYNVAMVGDFYGKGKIFDLIYTMRKTPGCAEEVFITKLPSSEAYNETIQEQIYEVVDTDAHFPGTDEDFNNWLYNNLKETGYWFGKAGMTIDVMSDGTITNVNIVKSINGPVDKSLKEAFISDAMPKWVPAVLNGKEVSQRLTIFINKPKKPKKK